MPRFLIEVTQPLDARAARRIDEAVRSLGSHFATHADWRREGTVSTGSLVVEADGEAIARHMVPPSLRALARIFELKPEAMETAVAASPLSAAQLVAVAA